MRYKHYAIFHIKGILRKVNLYVVFLLILFTACKHPLEEDDFFGDEYALTPDNFQLTGSFSSSTASVDFETTSATFSATLSHRVSWTITINGENSKARKIIRGVSTEINAINSIWDGSSDNDIFFRAGETCVATLTFLGSDLTYTDTITIIKVKKYEGVLLTDFDGGGYVGNAQWYFYSDIEGSVDDVTSSGVKSDIPTVQGTSYVHMRGVDQASDWYIGGLGHWYVAFDLTSKLAALSSDPDEIYLNMYVNSNGAANTKIGIRIYEKPNAQMDVFLKEVPITWTGWKLVSFKLSELGLDVETLPGGNALPDQLEKLVLFPQPAVPGATCEINADYIIFTKGAPFQH